MKGIQFVLIVLCILFIGFIGCEIGIGGNGDVISLERTIEGFNGISLVGVGNINIYNGENFKIVIKTDSNLQDRVLTTVNENILQISQEPGNFNATELTINIFMPDLKSIALSGAGNIRIIAGSATDLQISLSGAGNINAQDFQVQNITINHSGVGNARIWAVSSLNGTLSGVGNISYKGNPTVNINRTGVGTVKQE